MELPQKFQSGHVFSVTVPTLGLKEHYFDDQVRAMKDGMQHNISC